MSCSPAIVAIWRSRSERSALVGAEPCARRASPSHAGLPSSCTPCFETARSSKPRKGISLSQQRGRDKLPSRALPREGMGDGADTVACGRSHRPTAVCNQATPDPAHPIECHRARRERCPTASHNRSGSEHPSLDSLENSIGLIRSALDVRSRSGLPPLSSPAYVITAGRRSAKCMARPCGARWSSERANVSAASMYSASEVERLRSGP